MANDYNKPKVNPIQDAMRIANLVQGVADRTKTTAISKLLHGMSACPKPIQDVTDAIKLMRDTTGFAKLTQDMTGFANMAHVVADRVKTDGISKLVHGMAACPKPIQDVVDAIKLMRDTTGFAKLTQDMTGFANMAHVMADRVKTDGISKLVHTMAANSKMSNGVTAAAKLAWVMGNRAKPMQGMIDIINSQTKIPTWSQLGLLSSVLLPILEIEDKDFQEFDNLEDSVSLEHHKELKNAFHEIVAERKEENIQKRIWSHFEHFKNEKPIYAAILKYILVLFINYWITKLINTTTGITITNSILRKQPSSDSTTITIIDTNQQIIIIDEIPYYYQISYCDDKNTTTTGWISKRSVKKIETISDTKNDDPQEQH